MTSTSRLTEMAAPEKATDEALASRAALGDNLAFDEIAIRYQDRVYRLACRLVGKDDAPDVVQDGFLSVYRNLGSFRHESRFGTWLYRIVTNAALMHLRARTRRPVESLDAFLPEFDARGSHRHEPAELQVAARADELLDQRFLAEQATAALDRLPELYRSAFVLRDLEELTTAEVAHVLGIDPAAVRQRVHRARLMLRGYLTALAGVKS
jgi:RNA polymerase sigma-70 factor, ECF subfamily